MRIQAKLFLIFLLASPSALVLAEDIIFIACPVYRDTDAGPKSGCWLATERNSGRTFDIGSGLTKPLSNRAVLVEGVLEDNNSKSAELCGGLVLNPVRVSVLEKTCTPHILPAEGYPGRVFRPPGEVMRPLTVSRTLPDGPYENKTYTILFNFNSDFLNYQYSEVILEKISLYVQASKPKKIIVTGYAASSPLQVSGDTLVEPVDVAQARAEKVQTALTRLKVPNNKIELHWKAEGDPVAHYAGGLEQETFRRVDIEVLVSD